MGQQSVQKLFAFADRVKLPILEAALKTLEAGREADMTPATRSAFSYFAGLFLRWRQRSNELSLSQLFETIYIESGYQDMLLSEKDPQTEARIENIKELIAAAAEFEERFKEENGNNLTSLATLAHFLENVALISELDQVKDEEDRIIMMTLHGAKGLEFPYVFMTGMEEGLFPHINSIGNKQEVEEERRLCYVGITRAKVRVFLTHAEQRRLYNQWERTSPSRFLAEIPEECVERIRWGQTLYERYAEPVDDHFTIEEEEEEPEDVFVEGDMVNHRSFGFGVVLGVEGKGGKARITVDFQNIGKKVLIQEYARMQKV